MNSPKHDDVARRAQELWRKQQCPVGCDDQIWLEAEQQLASEASEVEPVSSANAPEAHPSTGAILSLGASAESDLPPVTAVEFHDPPPRDESGLKTELQKVAAREPILPTHFAPVATVPKSGKPLWARTHAF